jgi:hypothetical protein
MSTTSVNDKGKMWQKIGGGGANVINAGPEFGNLKEKLCVCVEICTCEAKAIISEFNT